MIRDFYASKNLEFILNNFTIRTSRCQFSESERISKILQSVKTEGLVQKFQKLNQTTLDYEVRKIDFQFTNRGIKFFNSRNLNLYVRVFLRIFSSLEIRIQRSQELTQNLFKFEITKNFTEIDLIKYFSSL